MIIFIATVVRQENKKEPKIIFVFLAGCQGPTKEYLRVLIQQSFKAGELVFPIWNPHLNVEMRNLKEHKIQFLNTSKSFGNLTAV